VGNDGYVSQALVAQYTCHNSESLCFHYFSRQIETRNINIITGKTRTFLVVDLMKRELEGFGFTAGEGFFEGNPLIRVV